MPAKKKTRAVPGTKPATKSGSTTAFETLLRNTRARSRYELLLYVAGNTSRSTRAIANVRSLCEEYLPKRYALEIVDIYQQPTRAAAEQIIAAPTLVKRKPRPPKRLIGDLSDRARVIIALNLAPARASLRHPGSTRWIEL